MSAEILANPHHIIGHIKEKEPEFMEGYVAQLLTYNKEGQRIHSQIVFVPKCEWYMPKFADYYAQTEYQDIEEFINDFGIDVAEKVFEEGEVVAVKLPKQPDLEYRGKCKEKPPVKKLKKVRYPYEGTKEFLSFY